MPEETRQLIKTAIDDGDQDLAETFLINAIQKYPLDLSLLETYADLATQHNTANVQGLTRAVGFLEAALFRVATGDVPQVQKIIERITAAMDASHSDVLQNEPVDIDAELKLLATGPDSIQNVTEVTQYLQNLQDLAAVLDEVARPDDAQQLRRKINGWQQYLMVSQQWTFLDACINNLTEMSDEQLASQVAVSIVQSAENSLPGLWSVQLETLPPTVKDKINGYPEQVRNWIDKVAEARSQEPFNKIASLQRELVALLKPELSGNETYEKRCQAGQRILKQAHAMLSDIPGKIRRSAADDVIQQMAEALSGSRQQQFDAYQLFVVQKCERVFRRFNEEWIVSEDDAKKLFGEFRLYEVDQKSLSPEASMCYNDVLSKLLAEVSPATIISCQRQLSLSPKKKVSDF